MKSTPTTPPASSYVPREGSKPALVIATLQGMPQGASLTTAEISALCETDAKNVAPNMAAAVKNGLLLVIDNAEQKKAYTLGDGTPAAQAANAAKRPVGRRPGTSVQQQPRKARNSSTAPLDSAAPASPALQIAIWNDGDVVVSGMGVNEDGESVTFSRAQLEQLMGTITRPHMLPPNGANHWPLLSAPAA